MTSAVPFDRVPRRNHLTCLCNAGAEESVDREEKSRDEESPVGNKKVA